MALGVLLRLSEGTNEGFALGASDGWLEGLAEEEGAKLGT